MVVVTGGKQSQLLVLSLSLKFDNNVYYPYFIKFILLILLTKIFELTENSLVINNQLIINLLILQSLPVSQKKRYPKTDFFTKKLSWGKNIFSEYLIASGCNISFGKG